MIYKEQLPLTPMDAFPNNPLSILSQKLISWLWIMPTQTLIVAGVDGSISPLHIP